MKRIEERTIDKSSWPRGPWDDEPDKIQWQDEETGLPCLIVRQLRGHLCGYVGVPSGHPDYGKDFMSACTLVEPCENEGGLGCNHSLDCILEVHGGVTYSDKCAGQICHEVEPGEPDDVWWLGFDCAHGWDQSPLDIAEHRALFKSPDSSYKSIDYVADQCRDLARQLKERESPQ